jgi:hypothetical protein
MALYFTDDVFLSEERVGIACLPTNYSPSSALVQFVSLYLHFPCLCTLPTTYFYQKDECALPVYPQTIRRLLLYLSIDFRGVIHSSQEYCCGEMRYLYEIRTHNGLLSIPCWQINKHMALVVWNVQAEFLWETISPMPLCSPQIPHKLPWNWSSNFEVRPQKYEADE